MKHNLGHSKGCCGRKFNDAESHSQYCQEKNNGLQNSRFNNTHKKDINRTQEKYGYQDNMILLLIVLLKRKNQFHLF